MNTIGVIIHVSSSRSFFIAKIISEHDVCLGAAPPKRKPANKQIYPRAEVLQLLPVEPLSTKRPNGRPHTERRCIGDVRGPRAHKRNIAEVAGELIPEVTQVRARQCSACKEVGLHAINTVKDCV
jgi:hypothetical protein